MNKSIEVLRTNEHTQPHHVVGRTRAHPRVVVGPAGHAEKFPEPTEVGAVVQLLHVEWWDQLVGVPYIWMSK